MDIQVSSNFERLLFEMNGRDGGMTAEQMRRFRATGKLLIEPDQRATFLSGSIRAAAFDDARTLAEIKRVYDATGGYVVEPHTATATAAARMLSANDGGGPVITFATAHPAKFPDAVEQATGFRPELPAHLADLFDREERTQTVANDLATVQALVEELTAR